MIRDDMNASIGGVGRRWSRGGDGATGVAVKADVLCPICVPN